jgi:hypothetical protein
MHLSYYEFHHWFMHYLLRYQTPKRPTALSSETTRKETQVM